MDEVRYLKKLLFLLILISVFTAADAQLAATQELPVQFEDGTQFTSTITVLPTDSPNFDISLLLPVTWDILDWHVTGNITDVSFEKTTISYKGKVNEIYHWLFDGPTTEDIVITYTSVPSSSGEQNITLLWFYPEGFGSKEDEVFVLSSEITPSSVCGDKICQESYGESLFTCPLDCAFRFRENIAVWLTILFVALAIIFLGMFYKIYRVYKRKKAESRTAMATPIVGTIRQPQMFKKMTEMPVKTTTFAPIAKKRKPARKKPKRKQAKVRKVKPKVVKMKPAKKKTVKKKPKKKQVKKKAVKKKTAKHTEFYSDTMKKLAKIRKSLK